MNGSPIAHGWSSAGSETGAPLVFTVLSSLQLSSAIGNILHGRR
uniref:Uncharacterized protein n=1 Tax=Anguilla anguilla TaxID=7936 RepID=A0A0E9XIS3_ANGAN